MTHAYSNLYLEDARLNLAEMFDYAINDCSEDADAFAMLFVQSGVSKFFEAGHPSYVAGMSGVELVRECYSYLINPPAMAERQLFIDRSPEYWAGYYLAEYQWYSGRSFINIFRKIPFSEIVDMYHPYHEMDITHFIDEMENRYNARESETALKKARDLRGLSQSELANLAGVNIRNIQLYEQRVNDINKAQAMIALNLARALCCKVEDILER